MVRAVATMACALVATAALVSTGGAAGEGRAAPAFVACGKVDLGYTSAKVEARGMRCAGAKGIFNRWERKANCPGEPCERTRVRNFVCRFGGSDVLLRLNCSHVRDSKAVRARWGG